MTNPDGSTETVYTDGYGLTMLTDQSDGAGNHWINYYEFNSNGLQILHANPSAVTGYDDSYADLVNLAAWYGAEYLSQYTGLIDLTDYYGSTTASVSTASTMTVSNATAGGAAGYFKDSKVEEGQDGTPILQETETYFGHIDSNGNTVFVEATDTTYVNTNGTGARTTTYGYTFYSGTNQINRSPPRAHGQQHREWVRYRGGHDDCV